LFVVLVGLSMDYNVFVLHRIQEEARKGASLDDAVKGGIVHSAGVVTSAAVVMVAVFAVFGSLSFAEFEQLGIGLAVAVVIDVIIIRGLLLPATLLATGRFTWWPGALYREARSAEQAAEKDHLSEGSEPLASIAP
jgi:RND superfamily putative drug exporter